MIRLLVLSLLLTACSPQTGWQRSNHFCNIGGIQGCPA